MRGSVSATVGFGMSTYLDVDPGDWIGSNDLSFAVRDANPVSPGHALVAPRRMILNWWDATSAEQHSLLDLVDVIKLRLDAEFRAARIQRRIR